MDGTVFEVVILISYDILWWLVMDRIVVIVVIVMFIAVTWGCGFGFGCSCGLRQVFSSLWLCAPFFFFYLAKM